MPRIINTEGIPENLVAMFMRRIVNYEREIGAELDEGHIALARFMFLARIDTMTANVTIQAPTEADIKKWIEESILETLAAGPGPGTITCTPPQAAMTVLHKEALEALTVLCELANSTAMTTAVVYEVDRLRLVIQRALARPDDRRELDAEWETVRSLQITLNNELKRLAPVDMVLYCPNPACGAQHIDAPMSCPDEGCPHYGTAHSHPDSWTNPPHRSHLCGSCGYVWRPADVPTNGVQSITTRGQNDSPIPVERATIADYMEVLADKALLTRELDVLLNGEAGAAKQAALCDIVGQVRIDVTDLRAVLVNYYPDCMPPHGSVIKWARDAIDSELSKPDDGIVRGRILDMHMDRDGHIRGTAAFPKGDELRASLKSMITPEPVPMYTTKPETLGLWKDAPELQKWLEQRYPKLRPEHGNLFSWALAAFEQAPYSWPPGVCYIDQCEYDRENKEILSLTIKKGDQSTVFVPRDGFPELTAVVHIEYTEKAGFKMQWVPQTHRPLEGATLYINTRNLVPIR